MRKHLPRALAALIAALLLAVPVAARQSPADYQALRKEMDLMRERLAAMQKEINELKAQRAAAPAPSSTAAPRGTAAPAAAIQPVTNITLNLSKAPIRGNASARVALVEVSDFECPFCARYSRNTSAQIVNTYVQTGKIRYAFVHLPIRSHRNAFKAAEASMCAADQGKFWEMRDRLFANQAMLAQPQLPAHAAAVGLNAGTFSTCLRSGKHAPLVSADVAMAGQHGVRATPTFFIGTIDAKTRSFTASRRIIGAKLFTVFQQALDAAIAEAAATTAP